MTDKSSSPSATHHESTAPCGLCGTPTRMTGTKRCDRCWELENRIQGDPALAAKILAACAPSETPRIAFKDWWNSCSTRIPENPIDLAKFAYEAGQRTVSAIPFSDKIVSVTLAFDFDQEKKEHTPWVMVCFPANDWKARDDFAKAIGHPQGKV